MTAAEVAANTITVGGTQRFVTIPTRLLNPVTTALIKNYFPTSSPDAPINKNVPFLIFGAAGEVIHCFTFRQRLTSLDAARYRACAPGRAEFSVALQR